MVGQTLGGVCGTAHIGQESRVSQVGAFHEFTGYLRNTCGLPPLGTAGTAPFQVLKILVQTPPLPDTNVYLHP